MTTWTCSECGTNDSDIRYPSGKMKKCMDCQRFYNITVNSERVRKNKPSPALSMTKVEFLAWCRSRSRECAYCGVAEAEIQDLNLKTQIGRSLSALGIDRIAPARGYEEDNIVFCCFACNKAKGDVFTHDEMLVIGRGITEVWTTRLP